MPNHTEELSAFIKTQDIHLLWFVGPTFEEVPDVSYIATVWDLQHRLQPFFPEVSSGGEWDFREEFFAKYLRRASFVITGSNTGKSEIEQFYQIPSERIKTLPHPTPGFALNASVSDAVDIFEKFSIPHDYLFYPAQFWAHKNHVNLLLALSALKNRNGLIVPVVFVGSDQGNLAHIRETIEQLGLSEQVKILGFVSHDELIALYRNAFALGYVTFFGPDNLPPLEAFALGCPVIASDVSGAREQLDDAALFVNPTNPEEIADAILSLYNDPKLRDDLIERGGVIALRWTNRDFVRGVFEIVDEFENIRRCWA
ncbi:MAG: glycosyltransferase family 4 protein [Anaerolineales bacterium]|nr:glycosyltransferase family 4 protein [Anaerolineales bacterium]